MSYENNLTWKNYLSLETLRGTRRNYEGFIVRSQYRDVLNYDNIFSVILSAFCLPYYIFMHEKHKFRLRFLSIFVLKIL